MTLHDQLVEAGVYNLDPERQDAIVAKMGMAGVQPEDLAALIAEARATCSSARLASAQVARLLDADVATLRRAIENSRRARAKARESERTQHYPGAGQFAVPGAYDSPEDRAARIAYCRVVSDRRPPAEVAAELGCAESEIAGLVERGRVMQGGRP